MAMKESKDGFGYDPEALQAGAAKYRAASEAVQGALKQSPPTIDAGISTESVMLGVEKLVKLASSGALRARDIANKVHAADGSYADVDQTNADRVKLSDGHRR